MKYLTVISLILSLFAVSWVASEDRSEGNTVVAISQQVEIVMSEGKTKTVIGFYNYRVKSGDNLWSLSRQFVVPEWMIREHNPELGKAIYPKQEIKIPLIAWKKYRGKASWYGPGFHKKPMASGETYDQEEILVAHRHYPIGLMVKITNIQNGKSIFARVEDRGPYAETDMREIDLSFGAAKALGSVDQGVIPVKIEPLNTHLHEWVKGYQDLV